MMFDFMKYNPPPTHSRCRVFQYHKPAGSAEGRAPVPRAHRQGDQGHAGAALLSSPNDLSHFAIRRIFDSTFNNSTTASFSSPSSIVLYIPIRVYMRDRSTHTSSSSAPLPPLVPQATGLKESRPPVPGAPGLTDASLCSTHASLCPSAAGLRRPCPPGPPVAHFLGVNLPVNK